MPRQVVTLRRDKALRAVGRFTVGITGGSRTYSIGAASDSRSLQCSLDRRFLNHGRYLRFTSGSPTREQAVDKAATYILFALGIIGVGGSVAAVFLRAHDRLLLSVRSHEIQNLVGEQRVRGIDRVDLGHVVVPR